MDLALAIFNIGAGLGIALVGVGLVILGVQLIPLSRETRAMVSEVRRLARLAEAEVGPILAHSREVAANAEVLSEDVAVKLDRLSDLMNSLQHTLETVEVTAVPRREEVLPVESWHAAEGEPDR